MHNHHHRRIETPKNQNNIFVQRMSCPQSSLSQKQTKSINTNFNRVPVVYDVCVWLCCKCKNSHIICFALTLRTHTHRHTINCIYSNVFLSYTHVSRKNVSNIRQPQSRNVHKHCGAKSDIEFEVRQFNRGSLFEIIRECFYIVCRMNRQINKMITLNIQTLSRYAWTCCTFCRPVWRLGE